MKAMPRACEGDEEGTRPGMPSGNFKTDIFGLVGFSRPKEQVVDLKSQTISSLSVRDNGDNALPEYQQSKSKNRRYSTLRKRATSKDIKYNSGPVVIGR